MRETVPTLVFSARSILARLTDELEDDPSVRWVVVELDEARKLLNKAQKMLAPAEVS